jgi:hypothetical protein
MIEKIRYKITINGMDQTRRNAINNEQTIKKMYLTSFPAQPNDLNFKEKSGISETSNKLIKATRPARK